MVERGVDKEQVTEIKRKLARRIAKFEAMPPGRTPSPNGAVSPKLLEQCMNADELGDGILFATLLRGKYLYNSNSGRWLTWAGHAWGMDIHESVLGATEIVVDRLLDATEDVGKEIRDAKKVENENEVGKLRSYQARLYERVDRLRKDKGRTICVKMARTNPKNPMVVSDDDMNVNPLLLATRNGVIDLESGRFRDGRPQDLISMSSPVEWRGIDEKAERWDQALLEIFDQDQELVAYVQRLFGMAIIGEVREHIFPVLWGSGRNGKGTIVETIGNILGSLAGPIQAEMLLATKYPRSSAGPSPDIMGLKGLRMAFASETDEGQRFSSAKVKWLSGGDTLKGRHPNDKYEVFFKPTHTLFLLTNHQPKVSPDDFAFWERLHLIPFTLSFVNRDPVAENERRADPDLAKRLREEAPGILAWLVRGCLIYQRDGLKPPEKISEATKRYKRKEDLMADFLDLHCELNKAFEVSASDVYHRFNSWYVENIDSGDVGRDGVPKGMSQKQFGFLFSRKFEKTRGKGGAYYYLGVKLKPVFG